MANRMIGNEPLSNAEKQRRYRARRKAEIEALKSTGMLSFTEQPVQDIKGIREEIKQDLIKSWEPEVKAERLAAERKKGRELAKRAEHTFNQARTIGICDCANYFIGMNRVDIAQHLLHHFMITRDDAKMALEADKRIKSLTLESLDKAGAWDKPSLIIK